MQKESKVLSIESVDPFHADAIYLLHEAAKEIRPLYDKDFDPNGEMPINMPAVPGSVYLIARMDGKPIGSAALRPYKNTIGEVIRMYVLPAYRRQQIARRLLEKVEVISVELGYRILRLETGNRQLSAMALYERSGYRRILAFGKYIGDPTSVCYEKEIVAAES
jgi:putative acetyltransferase